MTINQCYDSLTAVFGKKPDEHRDQFMKMFSNARPDRLEQTCSILMRQHDKWPSIKTIITEYRRIKHLSLISKPAEECEICDNTGILAFHEYLPKYKRYYPFVCSCKCTKGQQENATKRLDPYWSILALQHKNGWFESGGNRYPMVTAFGASCPNHDVLIPDYINEHLEPYRDELQRVPDQKPTQPTEKKVS